MTIEEIRDQFPFLHTGRVYLDHAAASPYSVFVEQSMQRYITACTHGSLDTYSDTLRVIGETRSMVAEMLVCDASRIAFTLNTSEGLNILAAGLQWRHGDHIVVVDQEFPANIYPFLNLRRHGVDVSFAPQRNGEVRVEDIERAMTPRTRLVAVSWVQFLSGYVIDLAALKNVCDKRGALLCVDAIQGIGAIRLNLAETPVDFIAAGVQKWQMAPQGVGIVFLSERVQDMVQQSTLGWLSVKDAWNFFDYNTALPDDARRYESGTYNAIGIHGYHAALEFFRRVGHDRVDELVRANAEHAWKLAAELGLELVTPEQTRNRAGIVTFRHEHADAIREKLWRRRITLSARIGHIRISAHFYNTKEDLERMFDEFNNIR